MTRLEKLAGLFTTDPFPDIKTVLADAAREGGWGNLTFKDRENHVYLDGERKGAFIGTEGDRQYIATNSSSFPIKGNKVTATAQLLKCPNREAFKWLCKKYNISDQAADEYKKKDPTWDGVFISGKELAERAKTKHDAMSPDKVMTYGVQSLDEQLGGIYPGDLIVLGGRPGTGKSSLVDTVVMSNAQRGKTVLFFQLEMDDEDPVQRRVYYGINRKLKEQGKKFIGIAEFRNRTISEDILKIRDEVYEEEALRSENVISYVGEPLDHERFLEALEAMRGRNIDLVVIDHLHYFEQNETGNDNLSSLMREIRYINKKYGLPFVLVSQLRKAATFGIEPTLDDLRGTGDIGCIATTGILIHREKENTKLIIDKSRTFGISQYKIDVFYDKDTGFYTNDIPKPKPTSFTSY